MCVCVCVHARVHEKEWQERVDPFKSYLSFAKEPCKRDREYRALLAEHRALLVEGTRQESCSSLSEKESRCRQKRPTFLQKTNESLA